MAEKSFTIDVIVGPEDGAFCAIALQMGLRGYGETAEAAMEALRQCADAHIEDAIERGDESLIFNDADDKYWEIFAQLRLDQVKGYIRHRARDALRDRFVATTIPLDSLLERHAAA